MVIDRIVHHATVLQHEYRRVGVSGRERPRRISRCGPLDRGMNADERNLLAELNAAIDDDGEDGRLSTGSGPAR